MSQQRTYKDIVDTYRAIFRLSKRVNLSGGLIQASLVISINLWLGLKYYEVGIPSLFLLSIGLMIKDFLTLHDLEKQMVELIVDGVRYEAMHSASPRVFLTILRSFNLIGMLLNRSFTHAVALWVLAYLGAQYLKSVAPDFMPGRFSVAILISGISVSICKLYYEVLKVLFDLRLQMLAKKLI